jgi:ceramide synthetase
MTVCEVYLLSYGEGRKWFQDYDSVGCPDDYDISWELENFVLLQLTIWLVTGFSCTFFEERRKDYLEMMFHHVLTNLIIGTAIVNKEHGWALLILFVHDSSDVLVDTLKLSNYMKYEGPKYFFLSEICFVTLVYCVWPLCRMYVAICGGRAGGGGTSEASEKRLLWRSSAAGAGSDGAGGGTSESSE